MHANDDEVIQQGRHHTPQDPPFAAGQALSPELQMYRNHFSALKEEAAALTDGLTERQFNWQPGPDAWSVAQCLHS